MWYPIVTNNELSSNIERCLQCRWPVLRHWLRGRHTIYSKNTSDYDYQVFFSHFFCCSFSFLSRIHHIVQPANTHTHMHRYANTYICTCATVICSIYIFIFVYTYIYVRYLRVQLLYVPHFPTGLPFCEFQLEYPISIGRKGILMFLFTHARLYTQALCVPMCVCASTYK